jgi:catechol 2,3-dioxygenase-like lactoylglutathione lyase family enzyme
MATQPKLSSIDVRETITEIPVSDLEKSREWYSRLLGHGPDLEPFPGNVEFKVGGSWLQIVKGKVQPSSWNFQVEVRDLSQERERLRSAGVEAAEIKTVPNVISYFGIKDPDGNSLLFFQVLTSDPKVTGGRK